ncbi:hypothetical protein VHEMI08060 [[Torrubiella] hemipterigena]|uniref:Carrier domain-containing protein n=1 Tax=[Torrubiella] hemipterigena TaxID=1531966 RepID=A0A0A1TMH5_9HYPO|nr:hypothetical protein VHEMI08060 [[Torrubiella] hemipterigena]
MATPSSGTSMSECWSLGDGNSQTFRLFQLQTPPPTDDGHGIILLSWLLVLLRTAEDSRVSFSWSRAGDTKDHILEEEQIIRDRSGPICSSLSSIQEYIRVTELLPGASILLSNTPLSQTMSTIINEPAVIHVEVRLEDTRLEIRSLRNSNDVLPYTIRRFTETLADTIEKCIGNPDSTIEELLQPTKHDLDAIWSWNHQLPPSYNFCMHEMIEERAAQYPQKEAIHSWDGNLTYEEIDRLSTALAITTREAHGGMVPQFIPVCFEKSKWTIVAVLAVMKLGACMVLMDPTLPLARLQNMKAQVGTDLIISSRKQVELATAIVPDGRVIVVDQDSMDKISVSCEQGANQLPRVSPSALMYIIFTSGSTGTPKGVQISHRAYTSSAIPRAAAVGYMENTRVLDFASYAFDVSIDSMLLTLGNGGTLCIPSDDDRVNDINGVIRRMRVTYAGITPSMARLLDSDVIQQLDALGLGGEAASARDVNLWGQVTRIIIGYGPCECTIGCTINSDTATGRDYISIGEGNGAAMWIVDPNNHEVLMPVGAVGELLVEGPIVGEGYLNDPEKTAAAFIHNPQWLTAGHSGYHGRQGRLYKTGDLGRFDPDGSGGIVFVGRKDTQVKLRGQRIELGEIESQLRSTLPSGLTVVTEVIKRNGQPTLVTFVATGASVDKDAITEITPPKDMEEAIEFSNNELIKVLPRYMVPTGYIYVNYVPTLISGKVDRKRLREFGLSLTLQQRTSTSEAREFSDNETTMQLAWAQVLGIESTTLTLQSDFFTSGGDSIAAMKLVSDCRDRGLLITVADIFSNPTLESMASKAISNNNDSKIAEPSPFSLLNISAEDAVQQAAKICGVQIDAVQDIYPCTPTQESLFTFSMKSTESYVAQRVAKVPAHISVDKMKAAWQAMMAASPILRTRVVQIGDSLLQVIIDEGIVWKAASALSDYLATDKQLRMEVGDSLARFALVTEPEATYLVWTIHHVVYDGWSEPLLLERVRQALQANERMQAVNINNFVNYIQNIDENRLHEFWKDELEGAVGPQFPELPSRDYFPTPNGKADHLIELPENKTKFTLSTLIRAAWALVASKHTGNDDVVFGETLMGRDIALVGVETICGPMVATVPVRIRIDKEQSVTELLQLIQQTILSLAPYQHAGMQNIRKVSEDAQFACETGTGIVIQPDVADGFEDLGFETGDPVEEALHFNPYPLMIAFGLGKGQLRISTSFDSSLVDGSEMKRIMAQIECVLVQFIQDPSNSVGNISLVGAEELDCIWKWNSTPPPAGSSVSHAISAETSITEDEPSLPVVVSWVCDMTNPQVLSPLDCIGELVLEGSFPPGEAIEEPTWLTAGSQQYSGRNGSIKRTGDIVKLRPDGTLSYIGRAEEMLTSDDQAKSLQQLQVHMNRKLPSWLLARAILSNAKMLVFIEQTKADDVAPAELLWMKHDIVVQDEMNNTNVSTEVLPSVSHETLQELKFLSMSIKSSLPSRLLPYTFICITSLPRDGTNAVDQAALQAIASNIPEHVIDQLEKAISEYWEKGLGTALTAQELVLRDAWSATLLVDATKIDVQDNFFRMGGDSVLAMKLVSHLRSLGYRLTVADIFRNMRLVDCAKRLGVDSSIEATDIEYAPFSLVESATSQTIRLGLNEFAAGSSVVDVLPATAVQALDVQATVVAPKTAIQYTTMYFSASIHKDRLLKACRDLIRAHQILRTAFAKHESKLLQVVLNIAEDALISNAVADGGLNEFVGKLCREDIENVMNLGSVFTRFFHVAGENGEHCLVLRLSHAQFDGVSLPMLLQDLEMLYNGQSIPPEAPFSRYLMASNDSRLRNAALEYWRDLLSESAMSRLDFTAKSTDRGLFRSKASNVKASALPDGITVASFVTAAWAVLLRNKLQTADVVFGSVTSGRRLDINDVDKIAGPCYQMTPMRVHFRNDWTIQDLGQAVQQQAVESAVHDFVGYRDIATDATNWNTSNESDIFGSLVHHQDWDDFDTMSFAGSECRVDIAQPHGDSPRPLKVVSHVKNDQLWLGIVASEQNGVQIDELLQEFLEVANELASASPMAPLSP